MGGKVSLRGCVGAVAADKGGNVRGTRWTRCQCARRLMKRVDGPGNFRIFFYLKVPTSQCIDNTDIIGTADNYIILSRKQITTPYSLDVYR